MNSAPLINSQLSVAGRLTIGFSVVIALFLGVAATVLYTSAKLEEAERWNTHTYQVLDKADLLLKSMINMETGARGFLISGEDIFLAPWAAGLRDLESGLADARRLTSDNPAQQMRLDNMKARSDEFVAVANSLIRLRRDVSAGKREMPEFIAEFTKARDKAAMDGFRAVDGEFDKAERDLLVTRTVAADAMRSLNHNVTIGGAVLAILLAAAMGIWVTRAITRQLGGEPSYAVNVVGEIARGDLGADIRVAAGDSRSLLAAMKSMRDSLAQMVIQIRSSSDCIATGSAQIATGNTDLSQRTEEQASNLEQTAASMEQLSSTVRANAETAAHANQLAAEASAAAVKGGEVVGAVVSTMQEIAASSSKIADIIGVIDGIAFQTNILALNAAVEAARAGEQGRGFAVVASEVRSLAGRSASAAKEIKSLIGASVEKVMAGTRQADEAGISMGEIVSRIQRMTQMIGEISSASAEQATGIGQVDDAVSQLDVVTQQNAALVEESAAAADSLRQQAARLAEVVSVFKLGSGAIYQVAQVPAVATGAERAMAPAAR
ncbi:methyl-accepting chemotaxis protein [Cupriavidus oxalaticus]|uniref:methyl-accepting chemotaxis protein n=1 Tax=Cupriavidus oxalaticus TaxID=96344 RepID=UPI00317163FB